MRINQKGFYIGVALVLIGTLIHRYISFFQTPFANGWDAYFYLDQIKHYNLTGELHTSRVSLFYPFLNFHYLLIGNYELAYKWCCITTSVIFVGASTYLAYHLSKKNKFTSLLLAAYFMASPMLLYFGSQYCKNLLGMAFLLFFIGFLFRKKYFLMLIPFVLTALTHKLTGGIALLITVIYLITYLSSKAKMKGTIIIVTVFILLSAGSLYLFRDQLLRQDGYFGGFSLPWLSFIHSMKSQLSLLGLVEIYILLTLFSTMLIYLLFKGSKDAWVLFLTTSILCFPFLKWDELGYSYRFFLAALILSPLLLCFIITKPSKPTGLVFMTLVALSFFTLKSYQPTKHDPPYGLYQQISNKVGKKDVTLIIAHKGLAEFTSFKTGIDVMPWIPDYNVSEDALFRIVFLPSVYAENMLPTHKKLSMNYHYLREKDWQTYLKELKVNDKELYNDLSTWKNPNDVRPAYLR